MECLTTITQLMLDNNHSTYAALSLSFPSAFPPSLPPSLAPPSAGKLPAHHRFAGNFRYQPTHVQCDAQCASNRYCDSVEWCVLGVHPLGSEIAHTGVQRIGTKLARRCAAH
eukprot:126860-Rhodomonas_salina.1